MLVLIDGTFHYLWVEDAMRNYGMPGGMVQNTGCRNGGDDWGMPWLFCKDV